MPGWWQTPTLAVSTAIRTVVFAQAPDPLSRIRARKIPKASAVAAASV